MPVSPITLTPNLIGPFKAFGINGPSAITLAQGLAQAFTAFLATIPVTTAHVGVLGAGTGTGKVTINPATGLGIVTSSLRASGIRGPSAAQLAQGIVQALSVEINTNAVVQVTIAGSSTGTGVGKLLGSAAAALTPLLVSNFTSVGIKGPSSIQLAQGLGQGIATWMKTATVNTVDVGTPAPPFNTSAGVGTGKVF